MYDVTYIDMYVSCRLYRVCAKTEMADNVVWLSTDHDGEGEYMGWGK